MASSSSRPTRYICPNYGEGEIERMRKKKLTVWCDLVVLKCRSCSSGHTFAFFPMFWFIMSYCNLSTHLSLSSFSMLWIHHLVLVLVIALRFSVHGFDVDWFQFSSDLRFYGWSHFGVVVCVYVHENILHLPLVKGKLWPVKCETEFLCWNFMESDIFQRYIFILTDDIDEWMDVNQNERTHSHS